MGIWVIFVVILIVVINKAKQSAEGQKYRQELEERAGNRPNVVDREKEAQKQREEAIRQAEARREEAIKRQEEAAKREADRMREELEREEARRKEELWQQMQQQGSYRSAARKDELLKKFQNKKNASGDASLRQEREEERRRGVILSRSESSVEEDFDFDTLEQEDYEKLIEDLIVMGPHYALSKDRDFLAEADELLWNYKVD